MSNWTTYTRLWIGGRLTEDQAAEIGELIDCEFGELQHEGEDQEDPASAFSFHAEEKTPALFLGMTSNGQASDACEYLKAHKIPFRRESSPDDQGDGEATVFDPDGSGERQVMIDADGEPVITLSALREAETDGYSLADVVERLAADDWEPPAVEIVAGAQIEEGSANA